MTLSDAVFWVLAGLAFATSIGVVASRSPVHSALYLLLTFLDVAVLFVKNGAEFLGAVQLLVYAGGIVVLFLFTIMLVNVEKLRGQRFLHGQAPAGVLVGVLVAGLLGVLLVTTKLAPGASLAELAKGPSAVGNSEAVAVALYTEYLLPFEIASVFLLVALFGAVLLGKRSIDRID